MKNGDASTIEINDEYSLRLGGFLCYTNGMNKNRGFLLLFALFIAILASVSSVADDLAGVMSAVVCFNHKGYGWK